MGMTPYNDTKYYTFDDELNLVDPHGVVIMRKDGTFTSSSERREQEKENFAKNIKYLYDETGDFDSPKSTYMRMANDLAYVDRSGETPKFVHTSSMSMADELTYRNNTGRWGHESDLDYFLRSTNSRMTPGAYALSSGKAYSNIKGNSFRALDQSLEGLTPSERMAVGSSSGFIRAYQNSAMKQDRIRLAEQDAVAKAATTGSFAGTPWEKTGQTGSLINL